MTSIALTPGNDTYVTLSEGEIVDGVDGSDTLTANHANTTLIAGAGGSILIANAANVSLFGGSNDDEFIVNAVDVSIDDRGGAWDRVTTPLAYFTLQDKPFLEVLAGSSLATAQTLIGNDGNNGIYAAADGGVIHGDGGADLLSSTDYGSFWSNAIIGHAITAYGGTGDDQYVYTGVETLIERPDEGRDGLLVYSSSCDLRQFANIEEIWSFGSSAQTLIGNDLDNVFHGSASGSSLFGGVGNDYFDAISKAAAHGGTGNDVYFTAPDAPVVEAAGEGTDWVAVLGSSYRLAAGSNVEFLFASAAFFEQQAVSYTLTGNELANFIVGGSLDDTLSGGSGDDRLDGWYGNDTMAGGKGDDIYFVDSLADLVQEKAGEGYDIVVTTLPGITAASFANVEKVVSASSGSNFQIASGSLTGSADDDVLVTPSDGLHIAVVMNGGGGNDLLWKSGWGDDTLDGGQGADVMYGDFGNDTYVVDNVNDTIIEYDDRGFDTVRTALDLFNLNKFNNIEYLIGTSGVGQGLIGNERNNTIIAGRGVDTLDGKLGNDVLNGGAGNDVLRGGAGSDRLNGGSGNDYAGYYSMGAAVTVALDGSVKTGGAASGDLLLSIENLGGTNAGGDMLRGNAGNNCLYGYGGDDRLDGGAGNDAITGGDGHDVLGGGAGADRFRLMSTDQAGDTIRDFAESDSLVLEGSAFGLGNYTGTLKSSLLQVRTDNHAQDLDDHLIYRTVDDTLWFDSNGSKAGGLTMLASFSNGYATMSADDILII